MQKGNATDTPFLLRAYTLEDEPFLFDLYASTRADELKVVPWTDEQKLQFLRMQFKARRAHYEAHYPNARHDIITTSSGQPLGRLLVYETRDAICIVDIAMMPESRGKGIGTCLIRRLQEEAATKNKPLRMHVEQMNPALRLYQRLGFKVSGDMGIYLAIEWRP